jgi:HEPN domain-containing protein
MFLFDNKYPKPLEIICYHCQQSVEKALKAYICACGKEVTKTHELGLLCRKCAESDESFKDYLDECAALEVYVTQTRYPNRIEIEEYNAKQALLQTKIIYEHVSEKIEKIFL